MSDESLYELFPGLLGLGAHVLPASEEPRLLSALGRAGFVCHVIAGTCVRDAASFFVAAAGALGLPDDFGANWDALADALGELHAGPERRVALVWRDAQVCWASDLGTLLTAALACDRVADAAADEGSALEPLQLELFLLGLGPAFGAPATGP